MASTFALHLIDLRTNPSLLGQADSESNAGVAAIETLKLLTGWTFIGWVGSLVWSVTHPDPDGSGRQQWWNGAG